MNARNRIVNTVWRGQVPAAAGFRGGTRCILEHAPPREQPARRRARQAHQKG